MKVYYQGEFTQESWYQAWKVEDGAKKDLDPAYHLANHSPDGFSWGYYGSGPAQLALAICFDYLGDEREALLIHQMFKDRVVARLPRDGSWELSRSDVGNAIMSIQIEAHQSS